MNMDHTPIALKNIPNYTDKYLVTFKVRYRQ